MCTRKYWPKVDISNDEMMISSSPVVASVKFELAG